MSYCSFPDLTSVEKVVKLHVIHPFDQGLQHSCRHFSLPVRKYRATIVSVMWAWASHFTSFFYVIHGDWQGTVRQPILYRARSCKKLL